MKSWHAFGFLLLDSINMDKSVQLLSVQQMNLLDVLLRIPIWDESSYQDHQLVQMTSPSSHCTTCLIGNPQLLQNHHSWTKIEINLYFVINYNLHVIIMCYTIIKKIFKNREDTVKNKFSSNRSTNTFMALGILLWILLQIPCYHL